MKTMLVLALFSAPATALPTLESIPALSGLMTGETTAVADVAGRAVPRLPIATFDRSRVPAQDAAELAKIRAAILADEASPDFTRFPIPLTKAFVERVTRRLLVFSGLDPAAVVALVNDTVWGLPTAKMNAGLLIVDPEGVAIMRSEDEAAAIIAHEVAHHLLGHAEKIMAVARRHPPTPGNGDIFSGGARASKQEREARVAQELEADVLSVALLANAGYDPRAAEAALRAVRAEMETEPRYGVYDRPSPYHPEPEVRYRAMSAEVARLGLRAVPRTPLDSLVFEELKNRRRPGPNEKAAHELHQHYRRPRP